MYVAPAPVFKGLFPILKIQNNLKRNRFEAIEEIVKKNADRAETVTLELEYEIFSEE